MEKPKIYLAHPMRGKLGSKGDGNYRYQNTNSAIAIENVRWLRKTYPEVEFYCPGEVEVPIQMASKLGYLSTEQILHMDLCILQQMCCGGLMHRWEASEGVDGEMKKCIDLDYPCVLIQSSPNICECDQEPIKLLIQRVLHYSQETN